MEQITEVSILGTRFEGSYLRSCAFGECESQRRYESSAVCVIATFTEAERSTDFAHRRIIATAKLSMPPMHFAV